MRRPLHTWIAFSLCLAVVLAAMGWVSLTVLRLDHAEALAKREAAFEETVRLALWRMDSALAPLIAAESARPYFQYSAFYPAERAYTRMFAPVRRGDILVPSPLLMQTPQDILLHFQFGPDGSLTSPQSPTGNMRDLAESAYTSHGKVEQATLRLRKLKGVLTGDALLARLPRERMGTFQVSLPPSSHGPEMSEDGKRQTLLNTSEWTARQRRQLSAQQAPHPTAYSRSAGVTDGATVPLWVGELLVLARRIEIGGQAYVQGSWLNWQGLKARLREEVRDLLPAAGIEPVRSADLGPEAGDTPAEQTGSSPPGSANHRRMLASLPARLVPGEAPSVGTYPMSPVRVSLVIAWGCMILGAGAVGALLSGALSLSERRGAFVSAVTHELRTPLTTFRMYAEMLAEEMVPDESKRREYLRTLCTEADRLGHLVENVLAYARLEGGKASARLEAVTLRGLVERAEVRLRHRAESSGMELVADTSDVASSVSVQADPSAIEQILFNLVDNACKYAASAVDRRIHLEAERSGDRAVLRVRDHGPGIGGGDRKRLFRPFSKSARDAAGSAPGVGLGLALSRRLARSMGGDLRVDEGAADGACFLLSLPVVPSASERS